MTFETLPASRHALTRDLTDLMWSTDPVLHRYMFGRRPTLNKVLDREWPGDHGLLSHAHAFSALAGMRQVGLLIGHTTSEYAENFDHSVTHQADALTAEEAAHLRSALLWMDRLFPAPLPESYYILEFAISPRARGTGLACRLLDLAETRARMQECVRLSLDVAADNGAVGFYTHLGFRTEVETRLPALDEAHGIGSHLHMEREIARPS